MSNVAFQASQLATPPVATEVRTEQIGGAHYQVVILALPDGSLVAALPISAATLPLPSGAATEATLAGVLAALGAPLTVSGPLTDAQLRAAATRRWPRS